MAKEYRYPGIRPFLGEDEDLFFGRSKEIRELHQLILARRFVVLFAKSGIGKTSLLNAGVLPLLKSADYEITNLRFQPSENLQAPTEVFRLILENNIRILGAEQAFASALAVVGSSGAETSLWVYLKAYTIVLQNYKKEQGESASKLPPLLVFDQFEEFFLHEEATRRPFVEMLADVLYERIPKGVKQQILQTPPRERSELQKAWLSPVNCKLIIAIRSDRLSLLDNLSTAIPAILDNRYQLHALDKSNAREAIVRPAQLEDKRFLSAPFLFGDDTLDAIFDSLSDERGEIESFQLQIICEYIEQQSLLMPRPLVIEPALLAAVPGAETETETEGSPVQRGIKRITKSYYERRIAELGTAQMQEMARIFIEDGLIIGGVRVSLPERAVVDKYQIPLDLLTKIVNAHIIRIEETHLGKAYEIAHDALVDPISESKEKREATAEKIRLEEEAIEQKRALAEEQRKRRRVTIVAIVAFVMMVVAIFASVWAWTAQGRAIKSEGKANELLEDVKSGKLGMDEAFGKLSLEEEKKQQIIDAFYFYEDKLALAYKDGRYGFINKKGEPVIDYKYQDAKPFDMKTGFAEVFRYYETLESGAYKSRLRKMYIDTAGNEYLYSEDPKNTDPNVKMLNVSGKSVGNLRTLIDNNPQLVWLFLDGSQVNTLPTNMGTLKNLRQLDLSNNAIKELPAAFFFLSELRVLKLNGNKLESVPRNIIKLANLRVIELNYNLIRRLPSSIVQLKKLEVLKVISIDNSSGMNPIGDGADFEECNCLEALPKGIENMNLKVLEFGNSKVASLPKNIGKMKSLESFTMKANMNFEIGGRSTKFVLPASFVELENLKDLNLSYNMSLNELPKDFEQLKQLRRLEMEGCGLKKLPENIGGLKNLEYLSLWNIYLLNELPESFGQLENLKTLNVNWHFMKKMYPSVAKLKYITILDMRGIDAAGRNASFMEELPDWIGYWTQVKILNLSNNRLNSLPESIGNMTSLEKLYLQGNYGIQRLPNSIKNLKNLKWLYLLGTRFEETQRAEIQRKVAKACNLSWEEMKQWW